MAVSTTTDKKIKPNLKYLRDKDREKVKGKFLFHEVPGGTMKFSFKAYREDPVETFTLVDGEIYSLPLGVAKHLNKNCWYPEHSYMTNEDGKSIAKIGKKVRRCSFQSLEFVDIEEMTPVGDTDLVTVENI